MAHNVNQWLTYNGNEYTVNGKTYRNLEEQVLHNKNLSQKNRDDIDALDARLTDDEERIEHLEDISTFRVKYNPTTGICDKTMGEIIEAKNNGALILLSTSNNTNTEYYNITNFNTNGTKHYIQAYDIGGDAEYPWLNILVSNECEDSEYPALTKTAKYKDVYICEWNVTAYNDVYSAYYDDGIKDIMVYRSGYWYYMSTAPLNDFIHFINVSMSNNNPYPVYIRHCMLSGEYGWEMGDTIATTTSIGNGSIRYIPTTSAVKEYVDTEIADNDKIFIGTVNTTTETEYAQAVADGKLLFCKSGDLQYYQSYVTATYRYFFNINPSNNNLSYIRFTRSNNIYAGPSSQAFQISGNMKSTPQTSTSYYPSFSYINNYEKLLKITFNITNTTADTTYATLNTGYTNGRPIIGIDESGYIYQLANYNNGVYTFQCNCTSSASSPVQSQRTIYYNPDGTIQARAESIQVAPITATYNDGPEKHTFDNGLTWNTLYSLCTNGISPEVILNGTDYPPIRFRITERDANNYNVSIISPLIQSRYSQYEYYVIGYSNADKSFSKTSNVVGEVSIDIKTFIVNAN